jgi:hypothetical protein
MSKLDHLIPKRLQVLGPVYLLINRSQMEGMRLTYWSSMLPQKVTLTPYFNATRSESSYLLETMLSGSANSKSSPADPLKSLDL